MAATAGIGGGTHRVTDLGFPATVVAVAAALTCIPGGAGGSSVLEATLLLLPFALAVAGVSLIAAGLCPTASAAAARALRAAAQPDGLAGTAALARRNVPVLAVSVASSAATGILASSAAQPVLCFVCFALFLLSISLATAGLASGTG